MSHPTNSDTGARPPGQASSSGPRPRAAEPPQGPPTLRGYELLVCVCGGIAAYKTAMVVSRLVQEGCGVSVAMTRNARRFVGPLTFEALSGRPVVTSPWRGPTAEAARAPARPAEGIEHLRLTEHADLVLVAPATANIIGKLVAGVADDLVSTLLLGAACPVLLAPAMNEKMWRHAAVQRNVAWLKENGFVLIWPESGWQACRAVGPGRMSEPETLIAAVCEHLRARPAGASAQR